MPIQQKGVSRRYFAGRRHADGVRYLGAASPRGAPCIVTLGKADTRPRRIVHLRAAGDRGSCGRRG
eukprot:scaffold8900_cov119-Isochrysis_galbana.AAC.7